MGRIITADTGRDITGLLITVSQQYGVTVRDLLAGCIAESDLCEQAAREADWPDVSYGLTQPTVAYLAIPGMEQVASRPGLNADTPQNRGRAKTFCWDAEAVLKYTAVRYKMLVDTWKDPLEAWCRWNWPAKAGSENPHRARYEEGYRQADILLAARDRSTEPPPWMVDDRGKLPVLGGRGYQYATRPLDGVKAVVVHYTAGPATQTPVDIARYQISDAAAPQTGTGRPFPGIAYTFLVTGDGAVHQCHDLTTATWHSAGNLPYGWSDLGANEAAVGVCYTGTGAPNPAQLQALARLIGYLDGVIGRRLAIYGHSETYQTACPLGWAQWSADLKRLVDDGGEQPVPEPRTTPALALAAYALAHPEYGALRTDVPIQAVTGGALAWTTPSQQHPKGCALVYREWLGTVAPAVWD